jgi:hypothetical protein
VTSAAIASASAEPGQQRDGGASDHAGRAGDDGDPAVQTNSIGHGVLFPLSAVRLFPDF